LGEKAEKLSVPPGGRMQAPTSASSSEPIRFRAAGLAGHHADADQCGGAAKQALHGSPERLAYLTP
jgi:hypothetical protein